jgi:hypothetical protein
MGDFMDQHSIFELATAAPAAICPVEFDLLLS